MTKHKKEILMTLTTDQLLYLIEQMEHSLFLISETCVAESKGHIGSADAVDEIRDAIYYLPSTHSALELTAYIDMKMNKITPEEYRKILGFN